MTEPDPRSDQKGYTGEEETSIGEYLVILLDEWKTLAVPFLLVVLVAVGYLVTAVPKYVSSGVLQVSTSDVSGANALLELTGVGQPSPVETEVEILRSRYIVGHAARKVGLNLSQKVPTITMDLGVSIGGGTPLDPDLVALRRIVKNVTVEDWIESPRKAVFEILDGGAVSVAVEGASPKTVAPGETYDGKGIHFEVARGDGPEKGARIEVDILPDDKLVQDVLENVDVEGIGGRKATNLVRISATNADRTVARDLVNSIMDAYMDFALEWRTQRADKSASFIEGQLEAIRLTLERAEGEMQLFVEESGAVLLPEQAKELIRSGAEMELELRKVRIQEELFSIVAQEITRARRKGEPVALTGDFLFDDQLMGEAIGALNELELKRQTLLVEMTPTHPQVVRIEDEIKRVRGQVLELVRASRDRIKERRKGIDRALDEIQVELAGFPDKERKMAVLRRKLEVSQQLYTFLMTKLEESRILKASTTTDKRIIDKATTPFKKDRPRRLTTLLLSAFMGLLLGVGAVFLRRAIDPRIRDEEEAKSLAQLPLYGVIPNFKAAGISGDSGGFLDDVWKAPKGPGAESFRTLRTNVEFAQVDESPLKVVQITSSEPSEGKSTVIANLGIALAKAGHRVLIVDLDLRRPVQHAIWSLPRSPGISDALVGRSKLTVRRLEDWGLDVLAAGNEPPESQRLLGSEALAEMIAQWRAAYDYVLLDTPPLLVADSLVVSRNSDIVLFVVRPRVCRRAALKLSGQTHKRMDVVKGLVVNGVITRRGGYYHYYRGSYYGSRSTDTQES